MRQILYVLIVETDIVCFKKGKKMGRESKKEEIYVYVELIHFAVQ